MTTHTFVVLAYKESRYLENCIQSVLNQEFKSDVVIATSTRNDFIEQVANKYHLDIIDNPNPGKGIGYDFDFARTCVYSDLVTIAHQDDVYDPTYSKEVVSHFEKYKDATILFTDYYELRNGKRVYENTNLKIKRIMLMPLHNKKLSNQKIIKRLPLSLGDPICCPAVTFSQKNLKVDKLFACHMKCDVDWNAWEIASKIKGRFVFINQPLMGHRIHEESTTTEIIEDNNRSKEDYEIFRRFWIAPIAKLLTKLYSNSEKSNEVNDAK